MPARSKVGQAGGKRMGAGPARMRRRPAETRVTVTFRHVAPTPALAQYAERKLGRISKLLKRPAEAHLILSVENYRQCGEVTIKSGRFMLSAQEETKDLYSVIDLLAAKIQRQVKKHFEKLEARKVRAISAGQALSESDQSASGAAAPKGTRGPQSG